MVETELSNELKLAGGTLLRQLDERGVPPSSAFWLLTEVGIWKLVLAEPTVGLSGPKELYTHVQRILEASPVISAVISLDDVAFVKPTERVTSLIRIAVRTGMRIVGIRF